MCLVVLVGQPPHDATIRRLAFVVNDRKRSAELGRMLMRRHASRVEIDHTCAFLPEDSQGFDACCVIAGWHVARVVGRCANRCCHRRQSGAGFLTTFSAEEAGAFRELLTGVYRIATRALLDCSTGRPARSRSTTL